MELKNKIGAVCKNIKKEKLWRQTNRRKKNGTVAKIEKLQWLNKCIKYGA